MKSGAGKVLTGLVKRIADGATGIAIGTPDDVAAFKAARGQSMIPAKWEPVRRSG